MRADVVGLAREMIRIPSLSGQEGEMGRIVAARMQALGFADIETDDIGSVIGCVGPRHADLALLFDAHMDVVPAAGTWHTNPYGGDIRDGRLYGRGATDMKGALAAALCGVAQAAATGRLTRRIAVSASVLEEQVEGFALGRILDRYHPQAVVICEPSKLQIKIGQKGRQEILLTLHGRPAHAALPEAGRNPIEDAAKALSALHRPDLPVDRDLGPALMVATDIISDPYPSISLIPSSVTIRFDRRTLPGETPDKVLGAIRTCLQAADLTAFDLRLAEGAISTCTGQTFAPLRDMPAWRLDQDHALVTALKQAVRETGRAPITSTWSFCTNGSESAGRRAIPTIGLGPGREEDAHTTDESIALEQLEGARDIYANLCRICAGTD